MCAILIKIINKLINEFLPMILMDFNLTLHIWLMDPSNITPQNILIVPIHAGLAKIRSIPVF